MCRTREWKKNWGVYNKIFEKFRFEKKKSHPKWGEIMKKFIFAKFSKQTIIFHAKFEFRMISALIWCTYCPYRSKICKGQIFGYDFFRGQTRWLRRPLTGKVWNIGLVSKSLQADKDQIYHLKPCLIDLDEIWPSYSRSNLTGWFTPPPHLLDRSNIPPS